MTPPKMAKAKPKMVVTLKLAPKKLAAFPHTPTPSAQSSPGVPMPTIADPTPAADTPAGSSSAATPVAAAGASLAPPPPSGGKRKAAAAPRGTKRGAAHLTPGGGGPKARAKPGPKSKKQKLDTTIDANGKKVPAPSHKLGPKANQGAINAKLRALDRTGKPCRKWEKKGFAVRSFTGVNWNVPTWRAPKNAAVFAEDVKSETSASSVAKVKDESKSSAISDKSGLPQNSAAATPAPPPVSGLVSSPAPVAAAP